jgi:hypothetical protein
VERPTFSLGCKGIVLRPGWLSASLFALAAIPLPSAGATPSGTTAPLGTAAILAPAGASFISASHGYLLGDYACKGRPAGSSPCLALGRTQDGGTSWQLLPEPDVDFFWGLSAGSRGAPTSVSAIDFANGEDGYLYEPGLEVTRNGGESWSTVSLGEVSNLTTAGGEAYALTTSSNRAGAQVAGLWQARLGSDNWSRVGLPAAGATYQLVPSYDNVMLLQQTTHVAASFLGPPGRIWLRNANGSGWKAIAVPCRPEQDGAAAYLALPPGSPTRWAIDCELDSQSSQAMDVQHRIFTTTNAGQTWNRAGAAPHRGIDAALAWNGFGDFLLATESASDELDSSSDGALRWHSSIGDGGDFYGWGNLLFVNTTTAFVVGPTHYGSGKYPDKLYRTVDGGARWSVVRMPDA